MRFPALAVVAAVGLAFPASAALVSWNTEGTFGLTGVKTFVDLEVRAYSTTTVAASGLRGATDGSSWLAAQLQGYGTSGFGIKNAKACTVSPGNPCTGLDVNEGSTPEHAVDNEQLVDVVVYRLPTIANTTWSFSSLSIGYTSNDSSPEVNVWIGGGGLGDNFDFSTTCFQNCGSGGSVALPGSVALTDRGFSYAGRVDFNAGSNGTLNAVINAADTGGALFANPNAVATGKYIVVAASSTANRLYDAFKIKGVSANSTTTPPPPPGVPEPGSLALLAGGLLGLAFFRKRQA